MTDLELLRDLDPPENALLKRIFEPLYRPSVRWPVWDWVARQTFREDGLDADEIYAGLPRVHGGVYGLIWHSDGALQRPLPHETVGLTAAGLAQLSSNPHANALAEWLVGSVRSLARQELEVISEPFEVANASADISHYFVIPRTREFIIDIAPETAAQLWNGERVLPHVTPDANERLTVNLEPRLREYLGVKSVEDYLIRVSNPPVAVAAEVRVPAVAPLTLPQTLDYLDLVLRADDRFGWGLLPVRSQLASVAKLAMEATTMEEFNDRASALCDVLDKLQVRELTGEELNGRDQPKTMNRLRELLMTTLPAESHERITVALDTLRDARNVRGGAQHSDAASKARSALNALGVGWPVSDWRLAWETIRTEVSVALDAIRNEIQATQD